MADGGQGQQQAAQQQPAAQAASSGEAPRRAGLTADAHHVLALLQLVEGHLPEALVCLALLALADVGAHEAALLQRGAGGGAG